MGLRNAHSCRPPEKAVRQVFGFLVLSHGRKSERQSS
jgi:hypothetical protein